MASENQSLNDFLALEEEEEEEEEVEKTTTKIENASPEYGDPCMWDWGPTKLDELVDLEKRLKDNRVLNRSENIELLRDVYASLLTVEQNPSKDIEDALVQFREPLIAPRFRHPKYLNVLLACCIVEILRITAPNTPYGYSDTQLALSVIVSSFEYIHDQQSQFYQERIDVLDAAAKIKCCLLMLDLELEYLIVKMFQWFLDGIREYHPVNVFASMEDIMTLMLLEIDQIPQPILFSLLSQLKKDDERVLPVAQILAERVLKGCAAKIKPCLIKAVNTGSIALDDYSDVVALIHNENTELNEVQEPVDDKGKLIVYRRTPIHETNFMQDLWHKIFLKLSVGCLFRSRGICKEWRDIIDSSDFSCLYQTNGTEDCSTLMVWQGAQIWWPEENGRMYTSNLEYLNDIDVENGPSFQGYCHGLLCCGLGNWVVVLSPLRRQVLVLPEFPNEEELSDEKVNCGIGYIKKDDIFKVVCIHEACAYAHVFSLGEDQWRQIEGAPWRKMKSPPVSMEGHIYWLCEDELGQYILDFDLNEESFRKILLPNGDYTIVDIGGVLGVGLIGGFDIRFWKPSLSGDSVDLQEPAIIPIRDAVIEEFGEDSYNRNLIRLVGSYEGGMLIQHNFGVKCFCYNFQTGVVTATLIPGWEEGELTSVFFTYKVGIYSLEKFDCRCYPCNVLLLD